MRRKKGKKMGKKNERRKKSFKNEIIKIKTEKLRTNNGKSRKIIK